VLGDLAGDLDLLAFEIDGHGDRGVDLGDVTRRELDVDDGAGDRDERPSL
jgi:hypothetical protein